MAVSFCLILLLITLSSFSQKIYFPKTNYSDSIVLAQHIPALAKELVKNFGEKDEAAYYHDLCRLQIVARQYDSALSSISSFNKIYCTNDNDLSLLGSYGFHYRVYSELMAANTANYIITPSAYQTKFISDYNELSEKGKDNISYYFEGALADYIIDLDTKIKGVKDTDSLTTNDAMDLCRSYAIYKVTSSTLYFGKAEMAIIEKEKYIEDDSVLVKMPDGAKISLTITRSRKITGPQPVVMLYNIYAGQDPFYTKYIASKG